jgi:hypothetical protein
MGLKKQEDDMINKSLESSIEKQKIELIKLRIRNKYYERDEVFDKVISEILYKVLKHK